MSGAVKAIGKVFKKVGQAIKSIVRSPVFKAIAIAAAIYFTGGMAAGAMASADAGVALSTTAEGAIAAGADASVVAGDTAIAAMGDSTTMAVADAAGDAATAGMGEAAADTAATGAAEVGTGAVSDAIAGSAEDAAASGASAATTASAPGTAAAAPEITGAPAGTSATDLTAAQPANAAATPLQTATASPEAGGLGTTSAGSPLPDAMGNMPGDPGYDPQNALAQAATSGYNAGAAPTSTSPWGDLASAGDKFLGRISAFMKTPSGMMLVGNAAAGGAKGYLDARAAQQQREFLANQRAQYSAVPDVTGLYSSGAVGRRIGGG